MLVQTETDCHNELEALRASLVRSEAAWHFTLGALGEALADLHIFREYARITCGHYDAPADLIEAVKARLER